MTAHSLFPHSPILQRFQRLSQDAPESPALICGASAAITTRLQLWQSSVRVASELTALGLKGGHAIAAQLPNSAEFVALFLAARRLNLTFVALDRDAQQSEVGTILQHFGVNALAFAAADPRNPDAAPTITFRSSDLPVGLDGIALLKLTSGSTGLPKGILTTEANLIADCENICQSMEIGADDRNLGAIPFSHSYGFSNLITPLLIQGTAIVYSNDYLPLSVLELSNRYGVTVVPGIPLIFEHLSRLPAADGTFITARTFISAGAPLQATTSSRFTTRYERKIHTFYGCSECGGISYDRPGGAVERGSVGTPLAGVELRISSEGSLRVRSAAVAAGYLELSGDPSDRFVDGEYRADDLVSWTAAGELQLIGRLGDLINTAGKKVNPREVEATLLQMPGIREAKVYGESAGARGEVVAAAIVADPEITRDSVREFCRARLSSHKVPRIVKLIEAIPLDERGKVKRSALAAL